MEKAMSRIVMNAGRLAEILKHLMNGVSKTKPEYVQVCFQPMRVEGKVEMVVTDGAMLVRWREPVATISEIFTEPFSVTGSCIEVLIPALKAKKNMEVTLDFSVPEATMTYLGQGVGRLALEKADRDFPDYKAILRGMFPRKNPIEGRARQVFNTELVARALKCFPKGNIVIEQPKNSLDPISMLYKEGSVEVLAVIMPALPGLAYKKEGGEMPEVEEI